MPEYAFRCSAEELTVAETFKASDARLAGIPATVIAHMHFRKGCPLDVAWWVGMARRFKENEPVLDRQVDEAIARGEITIVQG